MSDKRPFIGQPITVRKDVAAGMAAMMEHIPPGRIEVMIRAPDGGRIPAPWNFEVTDIDDHFPEIQDQLCAMIWNWADRIVI